MQCESIHLYLHPASKHNFAITDSIYEDDVVTCQATLFHTRHQCFDNNAMTLD